MKEFKQEYGGFSLLDESEKQEIVKMVSGEEGLKHTELPNRLTHNRLTISMKNMSHWGFTISKMEWWYIMRQPAASPLFSLNKIL